MVYCVLRVSATLTWGWNFLEVKQQCFLNYYNYGSHAYITHKSKSYGGGWATYSGSNPRNICLCLIHQDWKQVKWPPCPAAPRVWPTTCMLQGELFHLFPWNYISLIWDLSLESAVSAPATVKMWKHQGHYDPFLTPVGRTDKMCILCLKILVPCQERFLGHWIYAQHCIGCQVDAHRDMTQNSSLGVKTGDQK